MSHQIHTYTELRQQIHDDLRIQHPEWVEPNGECPTCDSYEARLTEMLDTLTRTGFTARFKIDDSATEAGDNEPRSSRAKEASLASRGGLTRRKEYRNQLSHKMAPCSPCNTDRREKIIASIITDRSRPPIKRCPLYERPSENLYFAKLSSAVIFELVVGNARWALGLYGTNEAAVRALKNGMERFPHVGCVGPQHRCNQIGTLSRCNKGEQTA